MDTTFSKYEIIEHLKNNDLSLYNKIVELYNICQNLLAEIPKIFSNYTLHDIGHSIRVIGYMNELVKDRLREYSNLHLAIIVYVGLLHDIGMVVSNNEKKKLYNEFNVENHNFDTFSEEDKILYLQNYIRKNHGKRVGPLLSQKVNPAMEIRGLLFVGETKSYDLSKMIADICQSHTEDCSWITKKLVSRAEYGNDTINPQHIAFLLRIGDVLDIDDRRAPYMLYKLLNPQGVSDNEWRQHIPITNYEKISYNRNKYQISFFGECSEPEIYRKLMDYIEQIESDLKKMNSICDEFEEHYKLNIKVPIKVSIETKGFVATPLRFNLQYNQISKLLMGEKIYGDKKDGLRELLQNAIDAVLLRRDIEAKKTYSNYTPLIGIEINKEKKQFIVFDNGVGMSDDILENYFFNIGRSYYISDEFNSGGYEYKPIGHFGIGFLACFMLSSKIHLETKHKDSNLISMSFDKDSPYVTKLYSDEGSFDLDYGTKIIMDYAQIIPDTFASEESIIDYINELLITDEYEFLFVNNEQKRLVIEKPKKQEQKKDEIFEYEYTLKSYPNIKFNMLDLFENNENVYIVDNTYSYSRMDYPNYINLAFFEEIINELEIEVQSMAMELDEILNEIMVFPEFIQELVLRNRKKLSDFYFKNNNIYGFFVGYLYEYINENTLRWYDVPVIINKDTFNRFLEVMEGEGLEKALKQFNSDIQYISIICKEKELTDEVALEIVAHYIELCESKEYITDVRYYSAYPIAPIEKHINLLGLPKTNSYIRIVENYCEFDARVYLKGIRVRDESIVLPYVIEGIEIENIYLNIKSNDYGTDVARNNFDSISKEKLMEKIIYLTYRDVISEQLLDKEERELVELFLDSYYGDK